MAFTLPLPTDKERAELARLFGAIASEAGVKVMEVYNSDFEHRTKADYSPVSDADERGVRVALRGPVDDGADQAGAARVGLEDLLPHRAEVGEHPVLARVLLRDLELHRLVGVLLLRRAHGDGRPTSDAAGVALLPRMRAPR